MPVCIDIKKEMIFLYELEKLYIHVSYNEFRSVYLDDNTLLCDSLITPVVSIYTNIDKNITEFQEDFIRLLLPTNLSVHQDFLKIYQKTEIIQSENKLIKSVGPTKETWKAKPYNTILPNMTHKIINKNELYMICNITSFSRYAIVSGSLAKNILISSLVISKNN
jgi:hypothetical protein